MVRATCSNLLVIALIVVVDCSLSATELVLADGPPVQWHKSLGGSDYDAGYSVRQTTDGGYIIAGNTESFGTGNGDIYLIKTEPNGNSQWQKTFGGSELDRGWSVQQTADSGYIIAGFTYSFGAENGDVYLIKTEPNGNSQWQKTFGGNKFDRGNSVKQTADGGYVIAGFTFSFGVGDLDIYLIKTEPNGNSQWQKTFGGIGNDFGFAVEQTNNGGYIIAGDTTSFGAGSYDVYIIKTEPNGCSQWEKTFGGSDYDSSYSVQQTNDGGYIITGQTDSFGVGSTNVYLIKTEPNGNSEWQKTFGGTEDDYGLSVQQTSDGGYIITGQTDSFDVGSTDVYLIKTDPNGNSQWQKTFGGSDYDCGLSVQQTTDGGYVIAGRTESFGAGSNDVYLIKLCSEGTLSGDLNCDGIVDAEDLDILVSQWLQPRSISYPPADIFGVGDGIVDFNDYAVLAAQWQTTHPCVPDDMVYIPDGEFEMGDHHDDSPWEVPVHAVLLDSFFMSKYEITNQQYCEYLNAAYPAQIKVVGGVVYASGDNSNSQPYFSTSSAIELPILGGFGQIDYNDGVFNVRTKSGRDMSQDPVVMISWYGAAAYCNWRSHQEGYEVLYDPCDPNWPCNFSENGYRLPTEAEWEYAARGGKHNPYYRFPWGDTISHSQANYIADPCEHAYDVSPTEGHHPDFNDGIQPYTAPVGCFFANGYGLYNMAGNVWEWCNDWWNHEYYNYSPYDNPQGPTLGYYRVLRSGGWDHHSGSCCASSRGWNNPVIRFGYNGFRVVLDLN